MQATLRTLILMFAATTIAVIIGWIYAYVSERLARQGRPFWRLVPVCSISLPLFIHAAAWEATLGKFGWLPFSAVSSRGNFFGGVIASAWIHGITGTAWIALILAAYLRNGDVPGEESARLEAGVWRSAFFVTLPATYPLTFAGALWVALIAATEISVVDLYGYRTLADEVYFQYALSPKPLPILLSAILPGVIGIGLFVLWFLNRHRIVRPLRESNAQPPVSNLNPTCGGGFIAVACLTVLATLMLQLPLLSLVIKAGWIVDSIEGTLHRGWSAAQLLSTLTDATRTFRLEYYWTAMLAVTVVGMTLPIAWWLAWIGRHQFKLMIVICIVTLFIPGPVISIAIMRLFSQSDIAWLGILYDRTLIPTGIAVLHRSVPLCCMILIAAYYQSGRRVDEAALLDGATASQRLLFIEIPRMLTPLAICSFVAGVLALGEISATELVLPPGVSTVARRVFGLLHSGVRYQESGLCLISSAIVISVVVAFRAGCSTIRRN